MPPEVVPDPPPPVREAVATDITPINHLAGLQILLATLKIKPNDDLTFTGGGPSILLRCERSAATQDSQLTKSPKGFEGADATSPASAPSTTSLWR